MKDASCHETKEIAEELGISATTLYKYKRMSKEDVENIANIKDYKKGKTLMDDYINIIFKMLKDEVPQEYIMAYVIKAGYKGSDRYLRDYINIVAKNNGMGFNEYKGFIKLDYPKDVTVITRYELLKYILTLDPKKNKNETTEKYMDIIIEKYPIVKDIRDALKSFHDTIFGGNTDLLDTFIESYDNLIPSFL